MIGCNVRACLRLLRIQNIRNIAYECEVATKFHNNKPKLHQFNYEYSASELKNELERLCDGHDPFAAIIQKYNNRESIKTHSDAMQLISYLLFISNVNGSRPPHLNMNNKYFEQLLGEFEHFIPMLQPDELVSAVVGLGLADVPIYHPVNQSLTISIGRALKDDQPFTLQSLANLAIFANTNKHQLNPHLFCADASSQIIKFLQQCGDIHQLRYVTIYYSMLRAEYTKSIGSIHKAKLNEILDRLNLGTELSPLLEILRFYTTSITAVAHWRYTRSILQAISSEVPNLSNKDLSTVASCYNTHKEPSTILPIILETAESRPDKSFDLDLIYCRLATSRHDHTEAVWNDLAKILHNQDPNEIVFDVRLHRIFKDCHPSCKSTVFQAIWHKMAQGLQAHHAAGTCTPQLLIDLCKLYSTGQCRSTNRYYRCGKFEMVLRELVLLEVKNGVSGWLPFPLATYVQFLVSSSDRITHMLPNYIVERVEQMAPQLRTTHIFKIVNGLEARQRCLDRLNVPAIEFIRRIDRIEEIMTKRIAEIVINEHLHIHEITTILRFPRYRDRTVSDALFDKIQKFSNADAILYSQTIIYITSHQYPGNIPKLNELMLRYVNVNRGIVGGEVMARLIYHLYKMGYDSPNDAYSIPSASNNQINEPIDFDNFVNILIRDFDQMPAISIVKACLALYFYRALPIHLITRIFSMDFIQRLQKEMNYSSNRTQYTKTVLSLVMQLNRSACLGYPEARIPWFQQNYVEANLSAQQTIPNVFYDDIYRELAGYVGEKSLIRQNHMTPYGYQIPFVLYFNSGKQLIPPPLDEGPQTLYKLAIFPKMSSNLSPNNEKRMKGFVQLESRHLAIMGYNVVHIYSNEWYAMQMSLPGKRQSFISQLIDQFSTRRITDGE